MNNFDGWYQSAMDDWDTASRMIADFEKEQEPDSIRDRLIREARKMKIDAEYKRVDAIAEVATLLKLMISDLPHGEFRISVPEYDLEVKHEW